MAGILFAGVEPDLNVEEILTSKRAPLYVVSRPEPEADQICFYDQESGEVLAVGGLIHDLKWSFRDGTIDGKFSLSKPNLNYIDYPPDVVNPDILANICRYFSVHSQEILLLDDSDLSYEAFSKAAIRNRTSEQRFAVREFSLFARDLLS